MPAKIARDLPAVMALEQVPAEAAATGVQAPLRNSQPPMRAHAVVSAPASVQTCRSAEVAEIVILLG